MKSTGEVMGIGSTFGEAFAKSQLGANVNLPKKGEVFISIKDDDKQKIIPIAKKLVELGFTICATSGSAETLNNNKIKAKYIKKVVEGRPNIVDAMLSNDIQLVINTSEGAIDTSFVYGGGVRPRFDATMDLGTLWIGRVLGRGGFPRTTKLAGGGSLGITLVGSLCMLLQLEQLKVYTSTQS